MAANTGLPDATDSRVKELADRLSRLEGMSGASASGAGDAREVDLRHELQETLARLREIQASLGTEGGEVESIRAASEEAEKLKAVLRRRDYRILHLTRALDAMSSGQARASTPP